MPHLWGSGMVIVELQSRVESSGWPYIIEVWFVVREFLWSPAGRGGAPSNDSVRLHYRRRVFFEMLEQGWGHGEVLGDCGCSRIP